MGFRPRQLMPNIEVMELSRVSPVLVLGSAALTATMWMEWLRTDHRSLNSFQLMSSPDRFGLHLESAIEFLWPLVPLLTVFVALAAGLRRPHAAVVAVLTQSGLMAGVSGVLLFHVPTTSTGPMITATVSVILAIVATAVVGDWVVRPATDIPGVTEGPGQLLPAGSAQA